MTFSKAFPKQVEGISYPKWIEVYISTEEEKQIEQDTKNANVALMKQCILDAKAVVQDSDLKNYQSDVIELAIALFEKLSSHVVYAKERRCKDKFDAMNV
jgi:hypothetical protein